MYLMNLIKFFECSLLLYAKEKYEKFYRSSNNYGITEDEFLSVYFYTIETQNKADNIYTRLNAELTSKQRSHTLPKWKYYLYYLFNAFRKLPPWTGRQDLYRGVNKDLVGLYPEKYKIGEKITLYGITSASTELSVMQTFLSPGTPNTIFLINEAFSGRCIERLSSLPGEEEVLFPPASRFLIKGIIRIESNATWIQIKQIPSFETALGLE